MVSLTLPDATFPFIWMQVRCWPELPLVSPTKRSWTTLGTFKDSCELQARIHTISTYILSWKVSNRKKSGAPQKTSCDLLRKKALTNLFFFHFPGFPRTFDWWLCSPRPDRISFDTNFGLEIGTCHSTSGSDPRTQSYHQLFRLNWIIHTLYITHHIVFSIASLVFSK